MEAIVVFIRLFSLEQKEIIMNGPNLHLSYRFSYHYKLICAYTSKISHRSFCSLSSILEGGT